MVSVRFILHDPPRDVTVPGERRQTLLQLALAHGLPLEHSCGGVCACSTCHVHVTQGMTSLSEPTDAELDRVEQAPDVRPTSRLACQCRIEGEGPIVVEAPVWNRNAAREDT